MDRDEMERLTAGIGVKSEKIRLLFKEGVERAEIARFLDISYQHVQNVLKRSNLLSRSAGPAGDRAGSQVYTIALEAGGKITLPSEYLARQGVSKGDVLICREDAGGLVIMSREAAANALRDIARERMPGEAALLDALLDRNRSS